MQIERTSQNYFSLKLHPIVQAGNHPISGLSERISIREELLSRANTSRILFAIWSSNGLVC